MAFTATQYLFKTLVPTSTTSATVGAYTVPAATRTSIIALTLTNHATSNVMAFADVQLFDGTSAFTLVQKAPLYPGGVVIIEGIEKHVLPTGGAVYVAAYATNVTVQMTGVEIT